MKDRSYRRIQALGTVLLLIMSMIAGVSVAAAPTDTNTVTHIDSCTTITQPGRYVLTNDIENSQETTCLVIHSDDVILNGNGHRIDGVDAEPSTGILVEPTDAALSNVVIRDVVVTDWVTGIEFSMEVDNSTVKNTVVRSNLADGIALFFNSRDNRIVDNTASNNGNAGIRVDNAAENKLFDNTVTQNRVGLLIIESGGHVLQGNIAKRNDGDGIALLDFVSDTLVKDNTAKRNSGDGVSLQSSSENRIKHNTIARNDGNGIALSEPFEPSENNIIARNVLTRNSDNGISLDGANNNTITRNTVQRNQNDGINLQLSRTNRITHNTVRRNGGDGVVLCRSDNNTLKRNTASNNSDNGFVLADANNNVLKRNTAVDNGGDPLVVRADSMGNQFINNTFES